MKAGSSRRSFLTAGLGLPVVGMAKVSSPASLSAPTALAQGAKSEIRYRTLGKTGLKVSSVGFGCMITSDPSVIEKAAEIGINYFDTARGYQGGNNERMVGAALKSKRKDIILSTKSHGRTRQSALDDLDTSLRELGTDHVDVWYLHAISADSQVTGELVDAQQTAKKAGKIRFSGVSTHSGQAQLLPALAANGKVDVILAAYNFTMDPAMEAAVEEAAKAGLGVVAMKVMAGGSRRVKPDSKLAPIFKREGAMVAALKWVLKHQSVHTTIPSMTDMEQLDDNMGAMASSFSEADAQLLVAQLERIRPLYCRMCDKCEGKCPQGLPVADMLRYLTYADGYGQFALGRENFLALPAAVQQVRCNLCPTCSVSCPFGVDVAGRLSKAQDLFA